MSAFELWLTIVGMTGVTLATRALMLVFGDRIALPQRVQHALRYAPAAALAALIVPEVLLQGGAVTVSWTNFKLIAGVAAIVTMLATRSMIATMVVGTAAFGAARYFFG